MKRVFVISVRPAPLLIVMAVVVVILAAAVWPRPQTGGEGGWAQTFISRSEALPALAKRNHKPVVAIIIDDFGSSRDGVDQMMAVKAPLTFAMLPYGPFTQKDAQEANKLGYEIIVHLPMEAMIGKPEWLGPNAIFCDQTDEQIAALTRMAISAVPFAKGVNVHMGSKASEDARVVNSVLSVVKDAGYYFIDSKTGIKSAIPAKAEELGIPFAERNVFLDGQQPKEFVVKRLKLAQDLALKQGYAIAIGHVGIEGGKVTAEAITEMLPEFKKKGVELVTASDLLKLLGRE